MHKCQSVCVADMVSMLVTFTKWQQTCMLLRSQDFRVWTGSDEARRAGRSLANVADSLLPNFQLVVWPPSQPDLGGSSRERKTIRANWDSFPTHFKALSQCQTHRFTRNVRGNENGNERYIFQQATLATITRQLSQFPFKFSIFKQILVQDILVHHHHHTSWASWVCSLPEL